MIVPAFRPWTGLGHRRCRLSSEVDGAGRLHGPYDGRRSRAGPYGREMIVPASGKRGRRTGPAPRGTTARSAVERGPNHSATAGRPRRAPLLPQVPRQRPAHKGRRHTSSDPDHRCSSDWGPPPFRDRTADSPRFQVGRCRSEWLPRGRLAADRFKIGFAWKKHI